MRHARVLYSGFVKMETKTPPRGRGQAQTLVSSFVYFYLCLLSAKLARFRKTDPYEGQCE
jgi:hypothetical protein